MDRCPPEVVHQIFRLLEFEEVSALRQAGRKFADIGIEYLTNQIRFHCTLDSIKRYNDLANHAILKNHITSLMLEGNLLADVGCEHSYAAHYDLEHHRDEPPPQPCTNRERRLYERNLAKFDREIQQKYQQYRTAYREQQTLVKTILYSKIGQTALKLPKLEHVTVSTVGRCRHAFSERFLHDFAVSCAMPMDQNPEHSVVQLTHLITPNRTPLLNLKSLNVHVLSPSFFTSSSADVLKDVFRSLRSIRLTFRLSSQEREQLELGTGYSYGNFAKNKLHRALAVASNLEQLLINFDDYDYYGPAINVKNIFGDVTWPKLEFLDLDTVCADEEYFAAAVKRQPSLKTFVLGFATLHSGTWASMLKSFSTLQLKAFCPSGIFEDPNDIFPMHHIDVDAYLEDRMEIAMSESVEWYVTDPPDHDEYNPLTDIQFDDPDELRLEYGSVLLSDDSEMAMSDEDSMPDLTDMDCD